MKTIYLYRVSGIITTHRTIITAADYFHGKKTYVNGSMSIYNLIYFSLIPILTLDRGK